MRRHVTVAPGPKGLGPDTLVERMRRGRAEAGLDCLCREAANDLLDRIGRDEDVIRRRTGRPRRRQPDA